MSEDRPDEIEDIEPILLQVQAGDPIGAAYRLVQLAGAKSEGRFFYDAGSIALSRRDELGDDALRFARIVFAEAVEREPDLAEAHHDLATTMRELGMAEDAILHYRRSLELLPHDADSMIGLGASQCDAGRVHEAVVSLRRAATTHPDSGQAFANLGIALEAAGEDEEAVGAYAKAVARFDAALAEATDDERATEAAARRRWTRIQHASLLERLERWPQAIVEFRRLHEEEQAIAEAEEEAEAAQELVDEDEVDEGPPLADAPGGMVDDDAGETLLDAQGPDSSTPTDDEEVEECEEETGRLGLGRIFARLVDLGRLDLAFVILDDLGGEVTAPSSGTTYAIYDAGDGFATMMAEPADGKRRVVLDPSAPRRRRTKAEAEAKAKAKAKAKVKVKVKVKAKAKAKAKAAPKAKRPEKRPTGSAAKRKRKPAKKR